MLPALLHTILDPMFPSPSAPSCWACTQGFYVFVRALQMLRSKNDGITMVRGLGPSLTHFSYPPIDMNSGK